MFATSGKARLAYDVTGSGPDVLLIHAGVNDRRSWRDVIERLSPRFRCVAYDMRGFGETAYEREDGWSPVDDAVAVMDAAGVSRAVVVAGSFGGLVALDLTLAHPDRVVGLVLIGTAVRGAPRRVPPGGPTAELHARLDATEDVDEAGRLEAWLWLDGPGVPEGRVAGPVRDLFLEMNDRALRAPDPGDEAALPDAWPRLASIAVPTLVLVGRLDAEDIVAVDEQVASLIPGARLRRLDGVAHVPQLEGDPATLDEIEAFVEGALR